MEKREWWLSWDMMDRNKTAYRSFEDAKKTYPEVDPIHVVAASEVVSTYHKDANKVMRDGLETLELIIGYVTEENPGITRDELAQAVTTIAKSYLRKAERILKGDK